MSVSLQRHRNNRQYRENKSIQNKGQSRIDYTYSASSGPNIFQSKKAPLRFWRIANWQRPSCKQKHTHIKCCIKHLHQIFCMRQEPFAFQQFGRIRVDVDVETKQDLGVGAPFEQVLKQVCSHSLFVILCLSNQFPTFNDVRNGGVAECLYHC